MKIDSSEPIALWLPGPIAISTALADQISELARWVRAELHGQVVGSRRAQLDQVTEAARG